MDAEIVKAAETVLTYHKQDDVTGCAAAGVALAHLIKQKAGPPAEKFSFKLEEDKETKQDQEG